MDAARNQGALHHACAPIRARWCLRKDLETRPNISATTAGNRHGLGGGCAEPASVRKGSGVGVRAGAE